MLSYVRKASLYEQAAFNFKGSFSQNLTAGLYVSAEGGVVGRPRPRNKSHVGKIPMGPPLPVEKTRPTGQGGIRNTFDRRPKSGGCDIAPGM